MKRENNKIWSFSELDFTHFETPINNVEHAMSLAYCHKNCEVEMHSHNFFEINIVVKGKGKHLFFNKEYDLRIGDVFIVPPSFKHSFINMGGLEIFHLLLSDAFFANYSSELKQFTNYVSLFEIEPYIRKNIKDTLLISLTYNERNFIFRMLDNLLYAQSLTYTENYAVYNYLVVSVIGFLCSCLENQKFQKTSTATQKNALNITIDCMEFIQTNCHEDIKISHLTSRYHLSRTTLLRYFTECAKTTPNKYLMTCRLNKAKNMLESTTLSMTTIAQECGFFDATHFTKRFKSEQQITPLQYRKSITTNTIS